MATGSEHRQSDTGRLGTRVPFGPVLFPVVLLVLAAFHFTATQSIAASRTWTSSGGGFTIEAEFVSFGDGKVRLKKPDGKEIDVPLNKLSDKDRRWVANEVRRRRNPTPPRSRRTGKPETAKTNTGKTETGAETEAETQQEPAEDAVTGDLGVQSVEMKLVPLEMGKGRKPDPTAVFMLGMTNPQYFFTAANAVKKPHEEAFRKAVQKEPKYVMEKPFLAVARFGSDSYAFALDAAAKNPKGYDTLYFDANRNGDLTDDKPIKAADVQNSGGTGRSQSQFDEIVVPMDIDGTRFDYRLCMVANTEQATVVDPGTRQPQKVDVTRVQIKSGAVREGRIQQGNKSIRVVLIDRNSNGRFDDRVAVEKRGTRLSVTQGDLLLVNPRPKARSSASAPDQDQHLVSRTVCIGKHFYKMEVTPAGDRLTLEPAKLTLGSVTNGSPAYQATVYSDDYGVVRIQGQSGQRIPLPVGRWKVADYTIIAPGPKPTTVKASFVNDAEAIDVAENDTANLKFGQPFRGEVRAFKSRNSGKLSLSLAILGAGGEQCTSFQVNGRRPSEPRFEVRDKDGKVVYQGKFEWG